MRSRRYWFVFASVVAALAACAGANGDPAPAAVEAGTVDPAMVSCIDAGATE